MSESTLPSDLVVTRNGVPVADQSQGIRDFKAACLRSTRADVRNPLLGLPAMTVLRTMSPSIRAALRGLLKEIAADARERAEKCWRTHKAPMAAYWKAVAVYAGHTARALR